MSTQDAENPASDLILYRTEDAQTRIQVRLEGGSVWLTQAQMAELYQVTVKTVSEHLQNVLAEGELEAERTIRKLRIVQIEGERQVRRQVDHYHLDAILAVGYRVRSARGTQFRQWATAQLSEYLVKGFVMDDARLKDPGGWDYFDELLARIRDIRASEKRFYQKVRDLFALSVDYRDSEQQASLFFAEVQNKLLYAVAGKTAAELVVARADPGRPNMGLSHWEGSRVRKGDVLVAKNYLSADEVDSLNRLVVIFLEQAELRVKDRKALTLDYWRENVDRLLAFNDRPVLEGAGSVSHAAMKVVAHECYDVFDSHRRRAEAVAADAEDIGALEAAERALKAHGKEKGK
ncbi:virulence RhuM family protein [Pseudoxanthomonas putridarboris]|uniref:Virulence RhuM family protein n=1 Tax=Pseudoxanthomonas putridarboris TaxID=752605 RepID=A0ABU9IWP5_9GAMM